MKKEQINEIFGNYNDLFNDAFCRNSCTIPKVNAEYDKDNIIIKTELPGVLKENISITLKDSILTIIGKKKPDTHDNYYMHEISDKTLSRSLELKFDVNKNTIQSKYIDGILIITLSKMEKEPINIKID